jgi:acyl transferase domain-containing protein/acyl carrier protein/NAD(P)-dependent dehydrogenase (short-subunit alcohol dehydrogenase family)
MACRLPEADSVEDFWQFLISGKSAVRPLPESIFPKNRFFDPTCTRRGTSYSDVGAFTSRRPVHGGDLGLEDSELKKWDECHLQFAAVAREAWNQSFEKSDAVRIDRCGVFVGHSGGFNSSELIYATMSPVTASYLDGCGTFDQLSPYLQNQLRLSFQQNMTAGRPQRRIGTALRWDVQAIADLTAKVTQTSGPRMVIESACASSSVAFCLASLALNANSIDAAIVGGASYNKFDSLILFSQAKSCSGRDSRPFDDSADGLISSEGFVVFVLKRMSDAIAHRDTIHAVITGAGIASDGRGKSLWAPRREGQIESMSRAYRDPNHIAQVQYVEAHATSTQVGDATETAALAEFFSRYAGPNRLPLGSVKSNLGHTLESAGLVGLLKTVLAMKHETLPPSINFETPNKQIDWASTPFDVVTNPIPWKISPSAGTRVAAVNAFGIGGLNVHLVVEQFRQSVHAQPTKNSIQVKSPEPIAVVGLGCVLPGATGANELSQLLTSGTAHVQTPPASRWPDGLPVSLTDSSGKASLPVQAGFIENFQFDWRSNRIPPKQVQNANPLQFMLLHAASEALKESGILEDPAHLKRTGVIVGTIFGGDFSNGLCVDLRLQNLLAELTQAAMRCGLNSQQIRDLLQEFEASLLTHQPALLDETGSFTSSTLASRITKHFNLMGGAFALDAGVASSEQALNAAANLLRNRSMGTVVCASGGQSLDYYAFVRMHADRELPQQPNNPEGVAPGEGVVAVVLQLLSEAKKQNRKILGVIDDVATASHLEVTESTAADSLKLKLEHKIGRIAGSEILVGLAANLVDERTSKQQLQTINKQYADVATTQLRFHTGDSVPIVPSEFEPVHTSYNAPQTALRTGPASQLNSSFNIVGCFPGQGSQSDEILRHRLMNTPTANQWIERANRVLSSLGSPPLHKLIAASGTDLLDTIWPIQASMLISDIAIAGTILDSKKAKFDALIGHSLGEIAALVVADSISLEAAITFVHARAIAVRNAVKDKHTGLLSVAADSNRVATLLKRFVSAISITHCNTPSQTVVGGSVEDLQQFKKFCTENKIGAIELNVPAAFHCSILESARWELLASVRKMNILPPQIPVLSTVSGRFVADPEDIRQNLIDQLVTPIDYVRDIQRLSEIGASEFVELGPGHVLTKLNRAILPSARSFTSEEYANTESSSNAIQMYSNPVAILQSPNAVASDSHRRVAKTAKVFDATSSRRAEMRSKSEKDGATKLNAPEIERRALNDRSVVDLPAQLATPLQIDIAKNYVPPQVPDVNQSTVNFDRNELKNFIIDFIVEHTGYPLDMIDSKWDLEADLGVDSIKQAQLFGELRQTFDLDPSRFRSVVVRTVDDICDAIVSMPLGDQTAISSIDSNHSILLDTNPSNMTRTSHAVENRIVSYVPDETPNDLVQNFTIANDSSPIEWSENQLNEFMIDFVVEHTGYPRDMVELDAEFESDLGLDSIKLAQLVGEIRSSFNLVLTQEDRKAFIQCRTLRDITRHLMTRSGEDIAVADAIAIAADNAESEPEYEVMAVGLNTAISPEAEYTPVKKKLDIASGNDRVAPQTVDVLRAELAGSPASLKDDVEHGHRLPNLMGDAKQPNDVQLTSAERLRQAIARANSFEAERRIRFDYLQNRNESFTNEIATEDAPTDELDTNKVTQRYEMRVQSKPIEEPVSLPKFFGRALIVGENRIANELENRLRSMNVDCVRLSNATSSTWADQFERHWRQGAFPHLFVTTPHDEDAKVILNEGWWQERSELAINDLFWLCQRWYTLAREANLLQDASFLVTPNLGGDFGFTRKVEAIEGGAIGALLKALIIECWMAGERRLNFKLVDLAPATSVAKSVDAMLTELSYGSYDTEIAYSEQGRGVVRALPKRVPKSTNVRPQRGDVWICTGGARGITSFVCQALAQRYGIRLNLIGATALMNIPDSWRNLDEAGLRTLKLQVMNDARTNPAKFDHRNPLKVWQNVEKTLEIDATLKKMRASGIDVEYHACDCSDWQAVEKIVTQIQEDQGPVRGILHGAGVGQDSRFDRKQPVKVKECFAAKMGGTLSLLQAVDVSELRHFIAFGSISGRFGANGHTDYSAANDGMIKICDWMRDSIPHVRTIGFHWHAWGDIGMATKPETKLALESIGMHFMPAAEGLERLIQEIEHGSKETEVLITDDRYHRAFYPAETVEQEGAAPNRSHIQALIDSESVRITIVDRVVSSKVNATFHPNQDPFLVEHRLNGTPLLPVVVDAELVVETAIEHWLHLPTAPAELHSASSFDVISLNNFQVYAPMKFFCEQPHSVSVSGVGNSVSEPIRIEVSTTPLNRNGVASTKEKLLCSSDVSLNSDGNRVPRLPNHSNDNLIWHRPIYTEITDTFYSGAPFRLIQRFAIDKNTVIADLTAPSLVELCGLHRNATGWRVPSAVLDASLFACGILAWQAIRPGVCLPTAFQTLTIYSNPRPGKRVTVLGRLIDHDEKSVCFDFDVSDDEGNLYIAARGYRATFVHE